MDHPFLILVATDVDQDLEVVARAETLPEAISEASLFRGDFKVVEIYQGVKIDAEVDRSAA